MPPKKKKAKTAAGAEWEWKGDGGKWSVFIEDDAAMLEARYQNDPEETFSTTDFSFNAEHKTLYHISFTAMTQTNSQTLVARQIRRTGDEPPKKKAKAGDKAVWSPIMHACHATQRDAAQRTVRHSRRSSEDPDTGEWNPYPEEDSAMLEAEYLKRGPKAKFTTKAFSFNKE